MNTYDWNAKDYEKNSQAQQNWAIELIEKLDLKGTEDILDLGCGDGKVTAKIAQLVENGSVVGIDNSKQMIELAKKKYSSSNYRNLTFQLADATDLNFEKHFDIIFSNAALHWVKDHKPVVKGLYKNLKIGGKILLQMGGEGNAVEILSVLNKLLSSTKWKKYFIDFEFPYGFLGIDEYRKLLLESGFNIKRVELIPKDMIHDGKAGLEGWIRTTWLPYTTQIPKEKRDIFIEEISSSYLAKIPLDKEGKAHVAMVRIEVEAKKLA